MSDKDRWNHQGYQELLRQNNEAFSYQKNQHYNSVSKRQNFRHNTTNSKQLSAHYNQSWKQSRAFEQPYKNHFGNNHHGNHQKRYNWNFNYSEANHHQQPRNYYNNNNFHHHPNSKANYYSKRGKYNQIGDGQKQKFQSQQKWEHCNYHQQDHHQHHPRRNQKFEERLQKEQEKPGILQKDDERGESLDNQVRVTQMKRSQKLQDDWKFNQKKLQLQQLNRQDSSNTTHSTIYDSNDQDFSRKKVKNQKKFFKKKYNQKQKYKGPIQRQISQNSEQEKQIGDPFLQNDQRQYGELQEQKIYAPYQEEEEEEGQEIFCQDDSHSVPTQPSPSNLSLFNETQNTPSPSPVVPITLPKPVPAATEAPLSAPQSIEKQPSLEFNPVILKVKLQTQKGPIDVSIRQLDNLTHIASQICQQYNLNQNLIPAIAYQFEHALLTLSYGPCFPNPNQAVMPNSQQQHPLELDNSFNPQNYSQLENHQHQYTYLNNQQFQN